MGRGPSLRIRLTLWFVAVFAVLQTLLVLGAVYLHADDVRAAVDDRAQVSARAMIDNLVGGELRLEREVVDANIPEGADVLRYAFRTADGTALVESGPGVAQHMPFGDWEVVPAGPLGAVFSSVTREQARVLGLEGSELRLMTLPLRLPEGHPDHPRAGGLLYFQAVVPVVLSDHLLDAALGLFATGVPLGLLVAMVVAWWIAGRAVSPLRQVSQAARSVSPERLDERVSLASAGPEVQRLQADLNAALERLEAGYRAQDQFISNVSHELRTPISVLLTEAQVSRLADDGDAAARAFVDSAERELQRLGRLVTSILSLARLENDPQRAHPRVWPNDLVLEAVRHGGHGAAQAGVHLVPQLLEDDDEVELRGDEELLQTLLDNLVRNALLHSPRAGRVTVRATRDGATLVLEVSDEGPGVPQEFLERVFERFTQAPSGRERGGTGIGLAIARRVAELHGGTIGARNHGDAPGCTFHVRLPGKSLRSA